jgi:hypothetical protein
MRKPDAWWLIALLALVVSIASCGGGDDDDDSGDDAAADDDVADDDAADDDAADDDTVDDDSGDDDTGFSCSDLSQTELALFTKIFCAGASYSNPLLGNPPFYPDDLTKNYQGKILEKVWTNLGPCVDYTPELWIYWYQSVGLIESDTTLSWAVDGIFWIITENVEESRGLVNDYLDAVLVDSGVGPDVHFIGAIVPKQLMLMAGIFNNRPELVQMLRDEFAKRPQASAIDFDYYMDKLLEGKVVYNGEPVGFFDVIQIDFLHATEFGHQLIADLFIGELNRIWPEFQIPTWGTVEILD